jgi:maltooligosyltrehalose synthase
MVRAQVRGIVDWAEVEPTADRDWKRASLLIREMEQEDRRAVLGVLLHNKIGLRTAIASDVDRYEDKALVEANEKTDEAIRQLLDAYQPWVGYLDTESAEDKAQTLTKGWESRFGSMSDPAVAKKIETVAKAMRDQWEQEATQVPYTGMIYNSKTSAAMPIGKGV